MFQISGGRYRNCDGITRRSLLQVGGLSLGGLLLPELLRSNARADAPERSKDLSVILIFQRGGPSHLDMWDLKPEAPPEFRGPFKPISSALPGYQVCEHMPQTAKIVDRLAIVRSVTHPDVGHESAASFLLSGYPPQVGSNEQPSTGSIVSKELGPRTSGFPAYVALPQGGIGTTAAYLGVAHNPFETRGDANSDAFNVRNLRLPNGMSLDQFERRMSMLKQFDRLRRDVDGSGLIQGMDTFTQQAWEMVTSPSVQQAFDLRKEDAQVRERYGRDPWGQNVLLARRLIEAGVRFVTIDMDGWDTHTNNFENLKNDKLPRFDRFFSSLIEDLERSGRLDSTLVLAWGEFGRTPRINAVSGRDHWSNVFTAVMAGGGLKRGIVHGQSDSRAELPKEHPHSPQDVIATLYDLLGIDRHKVFVNEANRPVEILNYGEPIREILA